MNLANPWVLPMLVMGLVLVATTWRTAHARSFVHEHALVAAFGALYTLPYTAELASTSLVAKLLWHRLAWVGIASMPAAALLLALRFVGRPVSARGTRLVWACAAAFVALSCTNELHGWLETPATWTDYGAYGMRNQRGGPGFWLFAALAYAAMFANLVCYGAVWLTGSAVYKRQGRLLFFGTSIPVVGNVFYLFFGSSRLPELDPTPLLYGITCLVYAYSLKSGLLQIIPVARHAIVDAMDDPVFVLDRQDRVIDANPAARRLARQTGAHDPTMRLTDFLCAAPELTERIGAGAIGELGDVQLGERCLAVRITSLSGGVGRLVYLRDITERARTESTQRAALVEAARAKRTRDEFIARMSHELRTPLHAVLGSSEKLLHELPADDERRRFAEASLSSAGALLDLVDDVLDFERQETDAPALVVQPFDVLAMLRELAESHGHVVRRTPLALVATVPDGAAWVHGDAKRMRQIVTNLLGNATKFTTEGCVQLRVECTHAPGGVHVYVRVEDEGPGIPEADLERVFEPFVQLDGGMTRSFGGAGLGLSICRQLATLTGARLALRNSPKRGLVAEVHWELPAAAARGPQHAAAALAPVAGRVYVVDDHPISRDVIGWLLESLSVEHRVFASGAELLPVATALPPAVVLIDLHMPDGGGTAVAQQLRAHGVTAPLVAFTADGRASVRAACLASGMIDLLQKPCSLRALQECLALHTQSTLPPEAPAVDAQRELELHGLFLRTVPGEWARMAEAFASGDQEEVRRLAHELAGAAAFAGSAEVVAACRALLEADDLTGAHDGDSPLERLRLACVRLSAAADPHPDFAEG